jgi:unsaturated chondroitin disaccharide hydrolase
MIDNPKIPPDLVPYWDYNAPNIPREEKDASAAAILASGLYELSLYSAQGKNYTLTADKILASLTESYRSPIGGSKGFILIRSVGSRPSNTDVNVPLSYADYYYLEALLRSKKLKEGKSLF